MSNFALAPALVNEDVLDYSTSQDSKIYNSGIAPLSATPYNLEPEGLHSFLSKLRTRSSKMGWKNIMNIPEDILSDDNKQTKNILDQYGEVTMEEIDNHVISYQGEPARTAQNCTMLYHCLISSVDEDALNKLHLYEDQ